MKLFGGQAISAFKGLFVTLVLVVALGVAQIWLWRYVQTSAQTLRNRQTEEQQLEELNGRIAIIEQNYKAQLPLLDQLLVVFPQASQTSQIVDRLEQLADRQRVELSIENITTQALVESQKNTALIPLLVTMDVKGAATTLLEYLAAVEHIQEIAVVKDWQIAPLPPRAPTPGEPAGASHQMTMNVIFYLQPE
ncbi:MAG: hypothetical protein HYZ63_02155 [Candidatus Andersenbacteria bacterium]|nr:hypothetical protein [Candidatus Andersenbacteria bacterium]